MKKRLVILLLTLLVGSEGLAQNDPQVTAARQQRFKQPQAKHRSSRPVPTPWLGHGHDDHRQIRGATYLKTAEEIQAMPLKSGRNTLGALSFPKGSGLRIVATGHSWMRPGFGTLPRIAQAAGLEQHLRVNTRGGEQGGGTHDVGIRKWYPFLSPSKSCLHGSHHHRKVGCHDVGFLHQ